MKPEPKLILQGPGATEDAVQKIAALAGAGSLRPLGTFAWRCDDVRSQPAVREEIAAAALAVATMTVWAQSADGEVRKIDKPQGKITLKHGEIKSLNMPPMTMVFRVSDPKMLDTVAVGDKVKFDAEKLGGNYTVTAIRKAD